MAVAMSVVHMKRRVIINDVGYSDGGFDLLKSCQL